MREPGRANMPFHPTVSAALGACIRRLGHAAVAVLVGGLLLWDTAIQPAAAQANPGASLAIPSFWDSKRRPDRPDLSRLSGIRFLTEVDYPPFNYQGFNHWKLLAT